MGVVASILDALRRVGRPTEKSALKRQDEQLAARTVLSRGRRIARTETGIAENFVATVAPVPEAVVPLSADELRSIEENASLIRGFLEAFGPQVADPWSLDELDEAFAAWSCSDDTHGYSDEAVVEILGAAYGQFCIGRLGMRWVKITDSSGTALALQGLTKDFRAWPYHSISKRIADREARFFKGIFISLESMSARDDLKATDAT